MAVETMKFLGNRDLIQSGYGSSTDCATTQGTAHQDGKNWGGLGWFDLFRGRLPCSNSISILPICFAHYKFVLHGLPITIFISLCINLDCQQSWLYWARCPRYRIIQLP